MELLDKLHGTRYIPMMELLDELHGTQYFSKVNLRFGYHQILMHKLLLDVSGTLFWYCPLV